MSTICNCLPLVHPVPPRCVCQHDNRHQTPPTPHYPRELQLTAELHGVISQLYRSPLCSSAIESPPLHPPPGPRIPPAAVIAIVIVHLSRAKSIGFRMSIQIFASKGDFSNVIFFFFLNRQPLDDKIVDNS